MAWRLLFPALRRLILSMRIRLLCARCGKEWRGGHECENEKKEAAG
jgi:hypothetical protein